jgi:ATP-dependent Clp protease ATP-binding subunit ClpB
MPAFQSPVCLEAGEERGIIMATTSRAVRKTYLDPTLKCSEVREFESELRRRVIGQQAAISQLVETYQVYKAGMAIPGRPIANLLFLGPTGTGKTRIVEAAAEILHGDAQSIIKIDCAEFQQSHDVAKLIGSPPGYVGHRETEPALSQERIDNLQTKSAGFTFVLFDEIEKASEALWKLLLGILDKATLKLGDNRKVDFSRTIICMTSNLGARELNDLLTVGIGFAPSTPRPEVPGTIEEKLNRAALNAAKQHFSPEFMNRLDKVIVFKTLTSSDLNAILDIELNAVQNRVLALGARPFVLHFTRRAKQFLLQEGVDATYGARHLRRAIERHLVFPLSNLIATGQTESAMAIQVDSLMNRGQLTFAPMQMGELTYVERRPCRAGRVRSAGRGLSPALEAL